MDIKYWFTIGNIIRLLPYACVLLICVLVGIVCLISYICYRVTKLNIFRHTIYIPYSYQTTDIKEIVYWINENIDGRCCIEEDIQTSDWLGHPHQQDMLIGWHIRFIKATDAMAFKLVWSFNDKKQYRV